MFTAWLIVPFDAQPDSLMAIDLLDENRNSRFIGNAWQIYEANAKLYLSHVFQSSDWIVDQADSRTNWISEKQLFLGLGHCSMDILSELLDFDTTFL